MFNYDICGLTIHTAYCLQENVHDTIDIRAGHLFWHSCRADVSGIQGITAVPLRCNAIQGHLLPDRSERIRPDSAGHVPGGISPGIRAARMDTSARRPGDAGRLLPAGRGVCAK